MEFEMHGKEIDVEEAVQKALKLIQDKNLFFHEDIIAYMGVSKGWYYQKGLNKMDDIKLAIEKNRVVTKNSMRKKWALSDNSALQISLYKLLSSEEELEKLSMSHVKQENMVSGDITITRKIIGDSAKDPETE